VDRRLNLAKNLCGKTRKVTEPYEIWICVNIGWTWRVLKKWQDDDNKPGGRWFCAVKTPMTYGRYDLGDVYVSDLKSCARKLTDKEVVEHLKNEKW
jgi:hypothetical protein